MTTVRTVRSVLLGPPGSGKGTQAEVLSKRLRVPWVSTGEMLRLAVSEATDLGRRVEEIMASGALVDDRTMAEVVQERLCRPDAARGFILDGYPRTVDQAETLEVILSELFASSLDAVVLIEVPEMELVQRALGRRRVDDNEQVIRRRLEIYRQKTEPVVGYYEARGLLHRVDGDRAIEAVTEGILDILAVNA